MTIGVVTIDLPQNLFETSAGPFQLTPFRGQSASPLAPSRRSYGPMQEHLWTFTMEAAPMGRDATIEMEAWFAHLSNKDWAFRAYDPLRQLPRGVGNGYRPGNPEILFTNDEEEAGSFCSDFKMREGSTTALVRDLALRNQTSLIIHGLDTGLAGQACLRKGDHFSVGQPGQMNLHMAVSDAIISADGEAVLDFLAPLWKRALPGDIVEFYRPTGRFGLYQTSNGTIELVRSAGPLSSGSLSAIEFPWQEAAD